MRHPWMLILLAGCKPEAHPTPSPAPSPAPEVRQAQNPAESEPTLEPGYRTNLDLGGWSLHPSSVSHSTETVQGLVVARKGADSRNVGNAADLAGLVQSWRSESDIEEFYRVVESLNLAEPVSGSIDPWPGAPKADRSTSQVRAIDGGFEVHRAAVITFGAQKIKAKPLKVVLRPRSYEAQIVSPK